MSADEKTLAQAMASVTAACKVMNAFHAELAGLFDLVDEHLLNGTPSLVSIRDSYVRLDAKPMQPLARPATWLPRWAGRHYGPASLLANAHPRHKYAGRRFRQFAFVWMTPESPNAPGFAGPECWFGVADPGVGKDSWEAVTALWNEELASSVAASGWTEGKVDKGFWCIERVSLAKLTGEGRVRELISKRLLEKFSEKFPA